MKSRSSHPFFCLFFFTCSHQHPHAVAATRGRHANLCAKRSRGDQIPSPHFPLSQPKAVGFLSPMQHLKTANVRSGAAQRGPPAQTKGTPSSDKWKTRGRQADPARSGGQQGSGSSGDQAAAVRRCCLTAALPTVKNAQNASVHESLRHLHLVSHLRRSQNLVCARLEGVFRGGPR